MNTQAASSMDAMPQPGSVAADGRQPLTPGLVRAAEQVHKPSDANSTTASKAETGADGGALSDAESDTTESSDMSGASDDEHVKAVKQDRQTRKFLREERKVLKQLRLALQSQALQGSQNNVVARQVASTTTEEQRLGYQAAYLAEMDRWTDSPADQAYAAAGPVTQQGFGYMPFYQTSGQPCFAAYMVPAGQIPQVVPSAWVTTLPTDGSTWVPWVQAPQPPF